MISCQSPKETKTTNIEGYIPDCLTNPESWMADLPDTITLGNISLPGTHNSGSATASFMMFSSYARCQDQTIAQQLKDGIRFLDIRINNDETLTIGHGIAQCEITFSDVLQDIATFLENYPTELIIMLTEVNNASWTDIMANRVKNTYDAHFSSSQIIEYIPNNLSEARGKLLVLKRSEACPIGYYVPFQDNRSFLSNKIQVEDCYGEGYQSMESKQRVVKDNLKLAAQGTISSVDLYLTYCSIAADYTALSATPYAFAWGEKYNGGMNTFLTIFLAGNKTDKTGIVITDFYKASDTDLSIVALIVCRNVINKVAEK